MSLDITLQSPEKESKECWNCGSSYEEVESVFWTNITHNLAGMASRVGIYKYLWRPEEIGISKAGDLIKPLEDGLSKLKANPDKYRKYNPKNGWGSYEGFVDVVEEYLEACKKNTEAIISVSR